MNWTCVSAGRVVLLSLTLIYGLVVVSGCDSDSSAGDVDTVTVDTMQASDSASNTNTPGRYDIELQVDGLTREFIVYVPAGAAGDAEAPVVLMLHGTTGTGQKFFNISGWVDKADEVGLIAVFPTALTHCHFKDDNKDGTYANPGERNVSTKWAAGTLGEPTGLPLCTADDLAQLSPAKRALADHPLADDLAFLDAVLDHVTAQFSVDSKRIYATGFSNGAAMTGRLAVERSDRYAAVAANAGTIGVPAQPASRPLSYVFTLGAKDEIFLDPNDPPVVSATLIQDNPDVQTNIVGPMLTVLALAGTPTYVEAIVGGHKVGRFTWDTSTAGADNTYTFALVEGLEHQYPNGDNHPLVMPNVL